MFSRLLVLASVACAWSLPVARSPARLAARDAPPLRRAATSAPAPTGVLRVCVTSLASAPLHRAVVTAEGEGGAKSTAASTDVSGWATLQLAPGRWVVSARRAGYLDMQSGQRTPLELPRPITVREGQTISFAMRLPRCGVLNGRVYDEMGEPAPGARVRALRLTERDGARHLDEAGQDVSNAAGLYSIAGLVPGTYLLSGAATVELLATGAAGEGRQAFAVTYYPGTSTPSDAGQISLGVEDEIPRLDFRLILAPVARISGEVRDSRGRAASASVILAERLDPYDPNAWHAVASGGTDQSGSFMFGPVAPGDYILRAKIAATSTARPEVASVPVSVTGDVADLTVVTAPGGTISGTFVDAGAAATGADPDRLEASISRMPTSFDASQAVVRAVPQGVAAAEGDQQQVRIAGRSLGRMFAFAGLSGAYLIRPERLPEGWWLELISDGKRNLTDEAITVRPQERVSVLVALTAQPTEVAGTVRGAQGEAASDYVVVVFPADRAAWQKPVKHIQAVRPDQDGRFSIKGLPAGSYLAAAVDAFVREDWANRDLLERLRSVASPVKLEPGQSVQLTLTLANLGR